MGRFDDGSGKGSPIEENCRWTGIGWDGESRAFQKQVCGGVHPEARPTVDGALEARKLCKGLHDVFLEGANICEIRVRLQRGGIFEETRRFVIIDDGIYV